MEFINSKNDIGIYIHIPFCLQKCNYCDFLSFENKNDEKNDYVKALVNEINNYANILKDEKNNKQKIGSIFLGGGTPSVLSKEQILPILKAINNRFDINGSEFTIECNPNTIDKEKLMLYKKSNINRISMGLQSSHDEELIALNRVHNYSDFLNAYNIIKEVGFENVNIDLMYGLPNSNIGKFEKTLDRLVALNPTHISAYSLILEENTPLREMVENKEKSKELTMPDEDEILKMSELVINKLKEKGYKRYEVSNYKKEGYECKHNIGYWENKPYIAMGLGATGFYYNKEKENEFIRYKNESDLSKYIKADGNLEKIIIEKENLDELSLIEEFMFLGLRMTKGISVLEFKKRFGKDIYEVYSDVLFKYYEKELLKEEEGFIKFTDSGLNISNYILTDFLF